MNSIFVILNSTRTSDFDPFFMDYGRTFFKIALRKYKHSRIPTPRYDLCHYLIIKYYIYTLMFFMRCHSLRKHFLMPYEDQIYLK